MLETEAAVLDQMEREQKPQFPDRIENPEAKRLWVEALRSGRYPQATGALHSREGWCCLGVACDVAVRNGVPLNYEINSDGFGFWDGMSQYLPVAMEHWMGTTMSPQVQIDEQAYDKLVDWAEHSTDWGASPYVIGSIVTLAEMNDNGVPFSIIAGVIERTM